MRYFSKKNSFRQTKNPSTGIHPPEGRTVIDPKKTALFEQWLSGSRESLVKMARSIMRDDHEAEDVVQDTLEAVWRAYAGGNVDNLRAYASRAVWLNALKWRARRRHHVPLDTETLRRRGIPEPSHVPDEDRELSGWELERAIGGLPSHQQAVIRLRFYGGMNFREIGHALSISMNTAASRCRYALAALRNALQITHNKEQGHE
jgi:RNA polymerase sigma factor (sigma-70 family)